MRRKADGKSSAWALFRQLSSLRMNALALLVSWLDPLKSSARSKGNAAQSRHDSRPSADLHGSQHSRKSLRQSSPNKHTFSSCCHLGPRAANLGPGPVFNISDLTAASQGKDEHSSAHLPWEPVDLVGLLGRIYFQRSRVPVFSPTMQQID